MSTDFDPEYYCATCFEERSKLVKWTFLPNPTMRQDLVVRVCEVCDGPEVIRLAKVNMYDGDDEGLEESEEEDGE